MMSDKEHLQKLLEIAGVGTWEIDFGQNTIFLSSMAMKFLEHPQEQLSIDQFLAMVRPDFRIRTESALRNIPHTGLFDQDIPIRTDHNEQWLHLKLAEKSADGVTCSGVIQQITRFTTEANSRIDKLLDQLPLGYIRVQLLVDDDNKPTDYRFSDINEIARRIIGQQHMQFIGKTAKELNVLDPATLVLFASLAEGEYLQNAWSEPGSNRYYLCYLYNTPGDKNDIIILFIDTTETIEANQALRTSEKLLHNIFQFTPVSIGIYDRDGSLIDINHTGLEMFGIESIEEIRGKRFFDNPNIPEEIKVRVRNREEINFSIRYEFAKAQTYHKSSLKGHVDCISRIRYLYDQNGELTNYLFINIDNTRLVSSETQVAEFENLFQLVAQYAKVGYSNYNLCAKSGYCKGAWLQNYGEPEDASLDQITGVFAHIHPEDRKIKQNTLAKFARGEIGISDEISRIIRPNGNYTWTRTHMLCREYRPEEGMIDLVGISYDITPLKVTEQQMRIAKERAEEANKLKSAFISNMSHEIRTPLNAIVGFSELLAEEVDPNTKKEFSELIMRNNKLLLQLISDILDLSHIESGQQRLTVSYFECSHLCRDILQEQQISHHEELPVFLAEELPEVWINADQRCITDVFKHLMLNAFKFTEQGSITLGYTVQDTMIEFYVRDTGIGIPEEAQHQIFERFYKVNNFVPGTGLGLSISKSLVEQMGGAMRVESCLGEGSTFYFSVPRMY